MPRAPLMFASVFLLFASTAEAYENICTHPYLVSQAVAVDSAVIGERLEFDLELPAMRNGATIEDGSGLTQGQVRNHFYNPRNRLPLSIPKSDGTDYTPGPGESDAITLGSEHFQDAIKAFKNGQKDKAYGLLGQALHLLTGDMAQPGHVHNDPHSPYLGFLSDLPPLSQCAGLTGDKSSPLEQIAEQACNANPPS